MARRTGPFEDIFDLGSVTDQIPQGTARDQRLATVWPPTDYTCVDDSIFPNHYNIPNDRDLAPTSQTIMDVVKKRITANPPTPEKPLVIIMGENHTSTRDVLLQADIVAKLSELCAGSHEHKVMFGYEQPHNIICVASRRRLNLALPDSLFYRPELIDPDGMHYARYGIHDTSGPTAYSRSRLMQICLNNDVPFVNADAARKKIIELDLDDPTTRRIYEQHMGRDVQETGDQHEKVSLITDRAQVIRHKAMVSNALNAAENLEASIIVQQCGFNHLYGMDLESRNYETSLSRLFQKAGAEVIPVFQRGAASQEIGEAKSKPHNNDLKSRIHSDFPFSMVFDHDKDALLGTLLSYFTPGLTRAFEYATIKDLVNNYSGENCGFDVQVETPSKKDIARDLQCEIDLAISRYGGYFPIL